MFQHPFLKCLGLAAQSNGHTKFQQFLYETHSQWLQYLGYLRLSEKKAKDILSEEPKYNLRSQKEGRSKNKEKKKKTNGNYVR